jgi:ATP-grasp domain, R2K clade family 2
MLLIVPSTNNKDEIFNISAIAKAVGWNVIHSGWRVPDHIKGQIGAVYGESIFCDVIADQMNWELISNPIEWITTLPEKYVSRKVYCTTAMQTRDITDENLIISEPKTCEDDEIVIVSEKLNFTSKYRCFINNKTVVSSCCYYYKDWNRDPEFNLPYNYNVNYDAVVEFVNNMLADPEVNCENSVIDIGRFKKDTYAVLKSKPAYTSELFGCEKIAALDTIKSSCKRR